MANGSLLQIGEAQGWRIVHLGPDAPIATVEDACRGLEPKLVVLSAVTRERVPPVVAEATRLTAHHTAVRSLA